MPAVEASGTQTCVVNTEHTLATSASHKTRTLTVDMNASAQGDIFEIYVYQPALSGGTNRIQWMTVVAHVQDDPIYQSPAVVQMTGGTFTIKQVAGTGRSVPWRVDTLD